MKKRLDIMMVEQGLAPSREKAKAYIMAGEVYVNGQKEDKDGSMFAETVKLEVTLGQNPYKGDDIPIAVAKRDQVSAVIEV